MMVKRMLLAATMLAAAEGTARAEMTPAQMFGAREDARQISLSPDESGSP